MKIYIEVIFHTIMFLVVETFLLLLIKNNQLLENTKIIEKN